MCGLAGILSSRPNKNIIHHITKMSASLVHRCPNSEGICSINNVGFGHRRLSIVDLSNNGSQPMKSFCGRYVIAFNGEIYNHLELRDQLAREGVPQKWKGHSDTETLLSSISTSGIDEAL